MGTVLLWVALAAAGEVEMEVRDVFPTEAGYAVVLSPKGEELILPIFVGPAEGLAIKLKLDGEVPVRPLTHDLLDTLIKSLGGKVMRITIDALAQSTFLARITVKQGGKTLKIDARPSDSIALALRCGAPIFTARKVIDEAGITREQLERRALKGGAPERPGVDL
jgi:uncharacterized protein